MNPGKRRASGEVVRAYARSRAAGEGGVLAPGRRSRGLLDQVAKLGPGLRPVLVCGETGTGKTLVAGLLHKQSGALQPLRIVNCAALSDGLLADLLWELDREGECARERNDVEARAGARERNDVETRASAHERNDAEGGPIVERRRLAGPATILLDEVGELSLWSQAVLLRNLQAAGDSCKARFFAATHRDLDAMAAAGSFSRELLARLSVTRMVLAPLRERRDEIIPLALHFLRLALRTSEASFISVDPELLRHLERYDWPGNVRELKNVMLGALAANESGTLAPADLPDRVRLGARSLQSVPRSE